eukprot:PITA_29526
MFDEKGKIVLISLYVDDLIITGNADELIKEIKEQMSHVFEMKDLGELDYCLGLEVWRDSGQTFLSHGKYVKILLKKFRMDQCKEALVPFQWNAKLQNNDGSKEVDATLYKKMVGSIIYLTTARPDLDFAVSVLSQFMSKPLENHWVAVKGVLRYLQGTLDFGIKFSDSFDVRLTGFVEEEVHMNEEKDQLEELVYEPTVKVVETCSFQTDKLYMNARIVSDGDVMLQQCHREIALLEYLLKNSEYDREMAEERVQYSEEVKKDIMEADDVRGRLVDSLGNSSEDSLSRDNQHTDVLVEMENSGQHIEMLAKGEMQVLLQGLKNI